MYWAAEVRVVAEVEMVTAKVQEMAAAKKEMVTAATKALGICSPPPPSATGIAARNEEQLAAVMMAPSLHATKMARRLLLEQLGLGSAGQQRHGQACWWESSCGWFEMLVGEARKPDESGRHRQQQPEAQR